MVSVRIVDTVFIIFGPVLCSLSASVVSSQTSRVTASPSCLSPTSLSHRLRCVNMW